MNDSANSYHPSNLLHSLPNQQNIRNIRGGNVHDESILKIFKEINEDIQKNNKELENFHGLNLKLKKTINELIQYFFMNDNESMFIC